MRFRDFVVSGVLAALAAGSTSLHWSDGEEAGGEEGDPAMALPAQYTVPHPSTPGDSSGIRRHPGDTVTVEGFGGMWRFEEPLDAPSDDPVDDDVKVIPVPPAEKPPPRVIEI